MFAFSSFPQKRLLLSTGILSLSTFFASAQAPLPIPKGTSTPDKTEIVQNYGNLPLSFEANRGQSAAPVQFLARGNGYSLFLTEKSAVLSLNRPSKSRSKGSLPQADTFQMELTGANANAHAEGSSALPGTANYFIGNQPSNWRTNIPTFAKVQYSAVYPGIDLVYYGNQRQLEFDFVVAPGANPKPIQLHFAGATAVKLNSNGDLTISAVNGQIGFHKPVIYQIDNGRRKPVKGSFQLLAGNQVGFSLGKYDRSRPLIIDPTLAYSTYFGGESAATVEAIAVDATGAVYATGQVSSAVFPVTAGVYQNKWKGEANQDSNAFVTKLNAAGSALLYETYFGGSGGYDSGGSTAAGEVAYAIAVDSSGDAYIAGNTVSSDFPVTTGAVQTQYAGLNNQVTNGFVTKLNPAGSELVYSTYLGGTGVNNVGGDSIGAIAVDASGDAFLAGGSFSTDFPVKGEALQKSNAAAGISQSNAIVAELNPTGTSLTFSTYLGGQGNANFTGNGGDAADAIALDSSGNIYVAGATDSADFPLKGASFQTSNKAYDNAETDAFIAELNPTGSALLYSTYLGGSGVADGVGDFAQSIALGPTKDIYVAGSAFSTDFPVSSNALQTSNKTGDYGCSFVSRVNPTNKSLSYSTYLCGSTGNTTGVGNTIAVDSSGNAYVTGGTFSNDFPISANAFQSTNYDYKLQVSTAFFTELNPTMTGVVYSTYLGGSGLTYCIEGYCLYLGDFGASLAKDTASNIYIAGTARSTDFPITESAYQTSVNPGGGGTSFIAKFNMAASGSLTETATALTSSANPQKSGSPVTFTAAVTPRTGTTIPNGTVAFVVDSGAKINVTLDATGHATYTTSSLTSGAHTVAVTYNGSTSDLVSNANLTETITAAAAATPTFSVPGGTYATKQTVTITDTTPSPVIYYTTNGTTPTTASTRYTAAITVAASETLEAIAVAAGYTNSTVAIAKYVIETPAATPVFTPAAGTYSTAQSVKLTDATAGAAIYYTLNGTTPTTASTKYTAAISVTASETIKAIAVATGYTTSAVGTAAYVIEKAAATPTFSIAAGTYSAKQTVTIADATPGAIIYYTTNGTIPNSTSAKYTTPIAVTATETVEAIAIATGYTNSAVAAAKYVIETPAATPIFSPAAGTYTSAQSIKITDTTPGAVIYYTTNGTAPTTASTKYTAAITVAATETVEAIAVATGYTNSAVATAKYTIETPAATPTFSIAAGTYAAKQTVTITDKTTGATIYYTTNGTTPTTTSTKYTAAISVAATETIEAIAVATGDTNSALASAKYTIGYPIATAIASSPGNQIIVLFTNPAGSVFGSASVQVVTN